MRSTIIALAAAAGAAGSACAQNAAWEQCGGQDFNGDDCCVEGYTCHMYNPYYAQCIPGTSAAPTSASSSAPPHKSTSVVHVTSTHIVAPTTYKSKSTVHVTSTHVVPSSSASASASASAVPTSSSGGVQYAGVNIAGFDFGCGTDGTCSLSSTDPPGQTGIDQIKHFVSDDGLNAFRLPVAWQYLVNNQLGGTLDSSNLATYDELVQGCLNAGAAMCIIDIHNYARWNGEIIGQGGPTNAQFASLWSQLATKYKSQSKVTFGIMNEPHDLDIGEWATSVQAAVTAIRNAGATSQKILLPGTQYTSGAAFVSDGSGAALLKVTNPSGNTDNLYFDVHQYLDSDNSGTNAECATNNVASFQSLGAWLRTNNRMAMLSETGGGPTASSCLTDLCAQFDTLNEYSDVYLGWTGWAAGMFDSSYVLSETPTGSGTDLTDQPLVKQCVVAKFKGGK